VLNRLRELDWLGLFLVSWFGPLVWDNAYHLTYFSSLMFWLLPTVLLLPRFLRLTDPGGRRRRALTLATVQIVALGVLLDYVFGRIILDFSGEYILGKPFGVPIEEVLFYAMGPIAMLLVYVWCDEYWLNAYNPTQERTAFAQTNSRRVAVSKKAVLAGVLAEAIGLVAKRHFDPAGPFLPAYFTFLVAFALIPAIFFFEITSRFVNWRAFGVVTLYAIVTSIIWEPTLAIPRLWWGYQQRAMIGYSVVAWSSQTPFPIEACAVWVAAPFACILVYEFMKQREYQRRPGKPTVTPAADGLGDHAAVTA
jgi:hypothetical protein